MADVVYIEQSHFSRMARHSLGMAKQDENEEAELLLELRRLVGTGQIVCPFSMAHLIETTNLDSDAGLRTEITRTIDGVSQGRCFKWPFDLVPKEMTFAVGTALGRACSPIDYVGTGLDAMPQDSNSNAARIGLAGARGTKPFEYLVGVMQKNETIRKTVDHFIDGRHAIELATAPERERVDLNLDQARGLELDAFINGPMFSSWLQDTATKFGLSSEDVRKIVQANNLEMIPTAAALVEIRARKDVQHGRRLARSDAMDTGHLLFLPHADWYLTENYAANLARVPGQRTQTVVLAKARDLLGQLRATFPP